MKIKVFISMIICLVLVQLVQGICCERNRDCIISETCQEGNCGNCLMNIYNRDGTINVSNSDMTEVTSLTYIYNISKNLSTYGVYPYTINCTDGEYCSGDCQVEVKQDCEEQEMNGLAIALFVMAINAALFILPFKIKFNRNELLDHILKRCSIVLGLFLLSLNTGIMAIIADASDIPVLQELFRYLWLINWTAYIAIVLLVLTTLWTSLRLWKELAESKRSGDLEYGE